MKRAPLLRDYGKTFDSANATLDRVNGNGQNPLLRIEKNMDRLATILERLANIAGDHEDRLKKYDERLREGEEHRERLEKALLDLAKAHKTTQRQLNTLINNLKTRRRIKAAE